MIFLMIMIITFKQTFKIIITFVLLNDEQHIDLYGINKMLFFLLSPELRQYDQHLFYLAFCPMRGLKPC